MIVEVIFGELFRLPTPEYLEICYGSILIELCRKSPAVIPQVLAQTTELLFERIDTMHPACIDRFANWFSYHLSNFQFRWTWDDWSRALELDFDHPKPKFIGEVFLKCMRLSYQERLVELVPKSFEKLIPPPTEPIYKFADRDGMFFSFFHIFSLVYFGADKQIHCTNIIFIRSTKQILCSYSCYFLKSKMYPSGLSISFNDPPVL